MKKNLLRLFIALLPLIVVSCSKQKNDLSINNSLPVIAKTVNNYVKDTLSVLKKDSSKLKKPMGLYDKSIFTLNVLRNLYYKHNNVYTIGWDFNDHQWDNEIIDIYLKRTDIPNGTEYYYSSHPNGNLALYTSLDLNLPAGNYRVFAHFNDSTVGDITVQSDYFTIYTKPTAPSGLVCIYRYYNPSTSLHFYTSDWEELGSSSLGFYFEKVTGYIFPDNSTAGTQVIYRYYNSSNGDHLYSIKTPAAAPQGYVLEGNIGSVYINATGAAQSALQRYFNSSNGEHFYKTPDESLANSDFNFESNLGYLQIP